MQFDLGSRVLLQHLPRFVNDVDRDLRPWRRVGLVAQAVEETGGRGRQEFGGEAPGLAEAAVGLFEDQVVGAVDDALLLSAVDEVRVFIGPGQNAEPAVIAAALKNVRCWGPARGFR